MAVIIETLMAEDLEYGVNPTTKTHPSGGVLNGTQISLSSFSTCGPAGEAFADFWTPGTIAAGSQVSETFDIPGAAPGDKVVWALDSILLIPLIMSAHVSANNEVTVTLANLTGVSQTIDEGIVSILVFKHRTVTPVVPV
jgi:hypothetical protein